MGKCYGHLSEEERLQLYQFREAGVGVNAAGRFIGRSPATISREWRRNSLPKAGYQPLSAQRMAQARRKRLSRIERNGPLMHHVESHLSMGWTPEQIAGRLKFDEATHTVSTESIYRYMYRPKIRPKKLYRYLPFAKAKRGRRYFKRRRDPIVSAKSFPHFANDVIRYV